MKTVLIMMMLFGGLSIAWGQNLAELQDMLRPGGRGYTDVAKLINESTPDRRQALINNLVNLVRDELAKPPQTSSIGLASKAACAFILIRDEQAILDAFQDGIGNISPTEEMDIVAALATCRDDHAAGLIERLARNRLEKLGETLIQTQDENERQARNDLLGSFVEILKSLARSANPSGGDRAKKIRDDFAALYASDNGKLVLAAIDAELAKIIPLKSAAVKAPRTLPASSLPSVKPLPVPISSEAKPSVTSDEPTSSTPWSVVVVLIVAAIGLLWLLLKRRTK